MPDSARGHPQYGARRHRAAGRRVHQAEACRAPGDSREPRLQVSGGSLRCPLAANGRGCFLLRAFPHCRSSPQLERINTLPGSPRLQNFWYLLPSSNPLFLPSVSPVRWPPAPFNPPFLPFAVSHWLMPFRPFKLSMLKHLEFTPDGVVVWKCLWGAVPIRLFWGFQPNYKFCSHDSEREATAVWPTRLARRFSGPWTGCFARRRVSPSIPFNISTRRIRIRRSPRSGPISRC